MAYQERMIRENLADRLGGIPKREKRKEFLTLEEVKQLAATPCQYDVLKRVALFSCFTELRYSDVTASHKNLYIAPEGGYCLRLHFKKTKKELAVPISDEAVEILGRVHKKGFVFDHITNHTKVNRVIGRWVEAASINKHITFHCGSYSISSFSLKTNDIPNLNLLKVTI